MHQNDYENRFIIIIAIKRSEKKNTHTNTNYSNKTID